MDRELRTELVREAYSAYAAGERGPLWTLLAPDVTFHVAGDHPLSGDYRGVDEVCGYLERVDRAGGGPAGSTVGTVFVDESGDLVLVETTSDHGSFTRAVGHVLLFDGDHLVELWDNPADPDAENLFWRRQVPAQRSPQRLSQRPGALSGRRQRAGALPAPRHGSSH